MSELKGDKVIGVPSSHLKDLQAQASLVDELVGALKLALPQSNRQATVVAINKALAKAKEIKK
jgi:hypothetical protein